MTKMAKPATEEKIAFMVWNCHRTKKVAVLLNMNEENIYEKLALKGRLL